MKKTIKKMKRQPTKWQKILPNDVTNKELISKIYKHFTQLNIKRKKKLNPKKKKNGQKIEIGISPKTTYRWPRDK